MKLGDLGLGRYFSSKTDVTHSTVGTPYYMSPECIQGGGYDFKSDIWSLGCLLYESHAARSPFYSAGLNFYMLGKRIMKRQFEPLGDVSRRWSISSTACCSLIRRIDRARQRCTRSLLPPQQLMLRAEGGRATGRGRVRPRIQTVKSQVYNLRK